MSREREFELEFRYLLHVEAKATEARIEWLVKLARDLRTAIPKFVRMLKAEDSQRSSDTACDIPSGG